LSGKIPAVLRKERSGWTAEGTTYWTVSERNPDELDTFVACSTRRRLDHRRARSWRASW